eukprot:CAMPEP_0171271458 /NCGR_PEP_ID=MMETSP0790-20130122/61243_1 /TAXON_ID=2925 /ORGANISM="Alexandrium catenella, Strain OF101" /LENGTH=655 /DNA_ID=CAMNT_0011740343 /DNA_START=95 /DNA_END=2062 /DNA_ORIENTATION=+
MQGGWLHCHRIQGDLLMYYGLSSDRTTMKLGLYAENFVGGWSALAIAGNGGMKGAHQLVVRKVLGAWAAEDRYSTDYAEPTLDAQQDVRLLFATEESGSTAWGVQVPMNSCDSNDLPIQDISQWIQWAKGSSHNFVYHGTSRGQFHANLVSGPQPSVSFDGLHEVDLRMPNVTVEGHASGSDHTNPYICAMLDLEALLPSHNISEKQHALRFSPYMDADSEAYVHHMILYGCNNQASGGFIHGQIITPCERMPRGCNDMKWGWAVGGQDLVMPPNVGMPIGEGQRWVSLQMHYYNPRLHQNVYDSSGVRISIADTLRPIDADLFQTIGGVNSGQRDPLPIGKSNWQIPSLVVPPACTNQWSSDLNVFGVIYHGHMSGKNFNLNVVRGNSYVGTMRHEPLYDFNHQSIEESLVKTLRPGDELTFSCTYDTSRRTTPVSFGDLTQQEMCYGAIFYYPKQTINRAMYMPVSGMTNTLAFFEKICLKESSDQSYQGKSECSQTFVTDPLALLGFAAPGVVSAYSATKICNFGLSLGPMSFSKEQIAEQFPWICPPCSRTSSCTEADMKTWGQQKVCPISCGQVGLSVWPDMSRTVSKPPTHKTMCGGSFLFAPTMDVSSISGTECAAPGSDETALSRAGRLFAAPTYFLGALLALSLAK